MPAMSQLVARDASTVTMTPTLMHLLTALIVLFAIGFLCVGALFILRSYRRKSKQQQHQRQDRQLPQHSCSRISHRRHGATTAPTQITISEKEMLVEEKERSSLGSPVPEIRITFPDEDDRGEKRMSQVMVITMSEKGAVGLEPFHEESLPPYQKTEGRMESLDLERMGGLKEREGLRTA